MLSHRVEGQGQPLLLIHGWGVTYPIWEALTPLLARHHQLVMVEMPGLGGSPPAGAGQGYFEACVEGLVQVREHLGLPRWSVLAYSIGARVAEAYLRREADRVERLVLLCPLTTHPLQYRAMRGLLALDRRWPAVNRWLLSDPRLHTLLVAVAFNGRPHPEAVRWAREIGGHPRDSILAILNQLPDITRRPAVPRDLPVRYIWAESDRLVMMPRPQGLQDRRIPGNHSAPVLAAPAVAAAALDFLYTTPAERMDMPPA